MVPASEGAVRLAREAWDDIRQEIAAPFQEVEAVLAGDADLLPPRPLPQADGDPGDENDYAVERAGA